MAPETGGPGDSRADDGDGAAATPGSVRGLNVPALGARLHITARAVQIALGCIWLLDAALQLQPKMFSQTFTSMLAANSVGQPAPIAWSINTMVHFIRPDVGVWNFLFAMAQLAIGVGLLVRSTVRPAMVLMFVWCAMVWWFGEGFGMLLTGTASPLTGAPGAVLLYAAIGILVWPRRTPAADAPGAVGVASSAAAVGPLGSFGALAVWVAFWVSSAVLWLLPANRAPGAVSGGINSMSAMGPGWYSSFLHSIAGHFGSIGPQSAWVLAIVSVAIGLGPLLSSRPSAFLLGGSVLQLAFWVTGMGLGSMLSGTGTDPSIAPLVVLLAVAMLPKKVPVQASDRAPIGALVRRNPVATWGFAAGIGAALLLSATYPVAAEVATVPTTSTTAAKAATASSSSSSSNSSSSVPGMNMSGGAVSPKAKAKGSGMASNVTMAGMAGLGVTAKGWKYTGPPLPAAEVATLTTVSAATDKGHAMQTPDCTQTPTAAQTLGAVQYVQAVSAAVSKYAVLADATAAGYVPITNPAYPVVHYLNVSDMKTQDILDPNHVDSLVYATTPNGPVLVAAMFLMPGPGDGPMPYGCLVQWHAHTNLCRSLSTGQISGFQPCAPGFTPEGTTPMMTHVWQVPVAGGPLAIDPSDLQVVEAAIMAQQEGLAPVTSPGGTPTFETTSTHSTP
jgi:hypothetical protein